MRSRQQLSELIEGRLSSADGRAELIKLATRLIVHAPRLTAITLSVAC
jgi:hypothetical protein